MSEHRRDVSEADDNQNNTDVTVGCPGWTTNSRTMIDFFLRDTSETLSDRSAQHHSIIIIIHHFLGTNMKKVQILLKTAKMQPFLARGSPKRFMDVYKSLALLLTPSR